jgi:glycosyltransferase involved in cell wall biosynthesis
MVGPQQHVAKWLCASDVYISASKREGLSNTLLEAMATGLPSAVTRVSGVMDLVAEPNAGFVVNVGDVDAMTAAIIDLASNGDLRLRMGEAARRKVENSYSIDAVTDGHERLYWRLVR